jgi:hypothetical protein
VHLVVIVILVVVVLGIVIAIFGWDRYRGRKDVSHDDAFQPTTEVFIDPDTERRMRVWYNPESGQREYRPE